jgi:hypothetical protein
MLSLAAQLLAQVRVWAPHLAPPEPLRNTIFPGLQIGALHAPTSFVRRRQPGLGSGVQDVRK